MVVNQVAAWNLSPANSNGDRMDDGGKVDRFMRTKHELRGLVLSRQEGPLMLTKEDGPLMLTKQDGPLVHKQPNEMVAGL
eukprot:scaffold2026_cov22-Tisochrysis_lutea.AAC.2